MEKGYQRLGLVLLLTLVPITIIGFMKSYLSHFPSFDESPGVAIHFHFIISALWIVLFIVQPILIRKNKISQHRFLGRVSFILFGLILLSFLPLLDKQLEFNYLPLTILTISDIVAVSAFYILSMYHKNNTSHHMRYMIVLAVVFAMPAIGRIFSRLLDFTFIQNMNSGFFLQVLVLLSLIGMDFKRSKNYSPYAVGLVFFGVRHLLIYLAYIEFI